MLFQATDSVLMLQQQLETNSHTSKGCGYQADAWTCSPQGPGSPQGKLAISITTESDSGFAATHRPAMPQFPGFQQPWELPWDAPSKDGSGWCESGPCIPRPSEPSILAHSAELYRRKWQGSHVLRFLAPDREQRLSILSAPTYS